MSNRLLLLPLLIGLLSVVMWESVDCGDLLLAPNSGLRNPNSIRFSQDSVRGTFSDGRSVRELTEGLRSGAIKPTDVPAVRLVAINVIGLKADIAETTEAITELAGDAKKFAGEIPNYRLHVDLNRIGSTGGNISIGKIDAIAPKSSVLRKEANVTLNRPLPGMGSGVHPNLPIRSGKKTQGIFSHGGTDVPLQSGVKGPGEWLTANLPGGRGSGLTKAVTHVEGHAAGLMRKHGLREADVYINYVGGPCKTYCVPSLPKLLPPGAKLRVYFPKADGTRGVGHFIGGTPGFQPGP